MSTSLPVISVIVPVYNSEKFLYRCLMSILNQTMKNIEIIVVNDGSTDSSLDIMKKFSEKYNNFTILNLKNVGAAKARNEAISIARGEYLSFVDSDDFILPNFLEILYNNAATYNADIVCCEYSLYIEKSNRIIKNFNFVKSGLYSNKQALNLLIRDHKIRAYLWNKLFKKSLFWNNNIKLQDMYYEDMAACTPLFYHSQNIAIVNKPLYFYTIREGSVIRDATAKNFNDYIRVLAVIRTFLENNNAYNDYCSSFIFYSLKTITISIKLIFLMHLNQGCFKNFIINIINSVNKILYCISKKFIPINNISDFPDVIDSSK